MTIKDIPLIYNLDRVEVYNKRGLVSSFWYNPKLNFAQQVEYNRTQLTGAENAINEKIGSMSICVSGTTENIVTLEIYLE